MSLKLSPIFIILLLALVITPSFAQMYSDSDIMNMYPNHKSLQNAINTCTIQYNQLPNDIKPTVDQIDQCQVNSVSSGNGSSSLSSILYIVIIIGISSLPIINWNKKILGLLIKPKHKVDDKEIEEKNDWDLSTLDDSLDNHDSTITKKRLQTKQTKIRTHHKFLVTLGLAKIVKKDE